MKPSCSVAGSISIWKRSAGIGAARVVVLTSGSKRVPAPLRGATKPLEAFKPKDQRDKSETNGGFLILAYDRVVGDAPQILNDDVHQWVTAVRYLAPEVNRSVKDVELRGFHAYRWDIRNDTHINAFGARATARYRDLYAGFDATAIVGKTREVSEALRVITNDPDRVLIAVEPLVARQMRKMPESQSKERLAGKSVSVRHGHKCNRPETIGFRKGFRFVKRLSGQNRDLDLRTVPRPVENQIIDAIGRAPLQRLANLHSAA